MKIKREEKWGCFSGKKIDAESVEYSEVVGVLIQSLIRPYRFLKSYKAEPRQQSVALFTTVPDAYVM